MKRSRFTEEQIAYALRLAASGTPVVDVCRQIGVSEATYYTWKKKYADLGVSELRRLKQLEDENARLRRIVADRHTQGKAEGSEELVARWARGVLESLAVNPRCHARLN